MFWSIDPSNGIAIYEQIVRQVTFAIANGALGVGDLVPSVRDLARTLAVNPNTVARAYRELQAAGVLVPVRGTGLAVAPAAPPFCKKSRQHLVGERFGQVLREARQSGLDDESVRRIVEEELCRTQDVTTKEAPA